LLFLNSAAQSKELIFYSAKLFSIFPHLFCLSKKVGKLPVSHRYNRLPLLSSDPGGIQQELVAQDLPGCKSRKIWITGKPHKNFGVILTWQT